MAKVFPPMKSMPHCIRSLEYEQHLYGPLRAAGVDDLRDLYSYVAFSLKEPATAQKLVNRIRKAARSLDALPGRHPVVDWEPWQSMGMHRFTVEDFLLFYLIDQSTRTVTLVRIVYGGRDLQNLAK